MYLVIFLKYWQVVQIFEFQIKGKVLLYKNSHPILGNIELQTFFYIKRVDNF